MTALLSPQSDLIDLAPLGLVVLSERLSIAQSAGVLAALGGIVLIAA